MAERTVKIRFTGDAKGVVTSGKAAETAIGRLRESVNSGFATMVKTSAAFASKMGSAVAAIQTASAAGAGLATASGALLALPAGAAAYAAVLGAVKLGAEGAARAQERFVERTEALRAAVASSYEKALIPAVDSATRILDKLRPQFQGIVTELGGMAREAARTAELPSNMKVLNQVTGGTRKLLADLRAAVAPLTQAFIDLISVAAPGLHDVGDGAGHAARRFAAWIRSMKESGELQERMQAGFDAVASFVGMLKDAYDIVAGVFRGISEGAGSVGMPLQSVLAQIDALVNSTEGQQMLRDLGAAMAEAGQAASLVLSVALKALLPLLGPLATVFGTATTAVAKFITPIIEFLAPGLEAIAEWIERNTAWLGPLTAAVVGVTAATWLFNHALKANPIMLVVSLLALLVTGFVSLWRQSESFRTFWIGAWRTIRDAVGTAVGWVRDRFTGLMDWFRGIPGWFSQLGRNIGEGLKSGFKGAVNWIIDMLNGLINGLNWVVDGINLINPFNDIPRIPHIPKLARGGTLLTGGLVEVGERGREIVSLPAGAQVSSKTDSDAMIAAAGGGGDTYVYIGNDQIEAYVERVVDRRLSGVRRLAAAGAGGAW